MKKLLLSALLLAGAMSPLAAQGLSFKTASGEDVTGTTYVFDDVEYWPQGSKTEVYIDPDLYIYSEKGGNVDIYVDANVSVQLCTIDNCEYGEKVNKLNVPLTAGVARSLVFDYSETVADIDSYQLPEIVATITAYYSGDPSSAITMTVKMGDVNAGVEAVAMNQNAIVFNGKTLSYDVNGDSQLSVYSLSGKTVLNKSVAGNGSLSLDGLSKGIYLYRLTDKNGKAVKSAKIIIK